MFFSGAPEAADDIVWRWQVVEGGPQRIWPTLRKLLTDFYGGKGADIMRGFGRTPLFQLTGYTYNLNPKFYCFHR